MDTLTTTQIHDAFATAIRGIVPTFGFLREETWHHTAGARETEIEGARLRNFHIVVSMGVPTYLWMGGPGTAYMCWVEVVTSYAHDELDATILDHMKTEDAVDLRSALSALRDPTLPGLADVKQLPPQRERLDSSDNIVIPHRYEVHYNQLTP